MGDSERKCNSSEDIAFLQKVAGPNFDHEGATGGDGLARPTRLIHVVIGVLSLIIAGCVLLKWADVIRPPAEEQQDQRAKLISQSPTLFEGMDSSAETRSSVPSSVPNEVEWNLDGNSPKLDLLIGSGLDGSNGRARLLRVQGPGRCLNPHPGPFRSWPGQQNGCLVQVWRQWQDGCTHFQWANNCNGSWDPQIYWTYCVH